MSDRRLGDLPAAGPAVEGVVPGAAAREELPPEPVSLGQRLRDPRTIVSILVPLVLVVLIAASLRGIRWDQLWGSILNADKLLLLGAFGIYYLGFPLRGLRWAALLRPTGARVGLRDSTEIVFISWLVNCLVPARLGDVYRAYLLRLNFPVSLSRTLGTVFIERVFDLFAVILLGLLAGFWSFRGGLSFEVQVIFGFGIVVAIALMVGLFTLRNFGRRSLVRLPLPHRVVELYDRFEQGVFSIQRRQIVPLALITALIWATEAARLFLVIAALGFSDVHLGPSGTVFVALAASLLSAIPFAPAGLGIVELGVGTLLTVLYGVPPTEATAIVLVDRAISVLSVIVLGSMAYLASDKTKAKAKPDVEVAPAG